MGESRSRLRLSLAWKVLLTFALVVLAGVAAFSLLANQSVAREVRGFMFRGGMTDSALLAANLGDYYRIHGSWDGVGVLLANPSPWHEMMGSRAGAGGWRGMAGMESMMDPAIILAESGGRVIAGAQIQGNILPADELARGTPIVVADRTVGVLLVAGPQVSSLGEGLIGRLARATWIVGAVVGVAALLAGSILVSGLLRPVRELTAASRALARGDLARRVRVQSHDELGELSAAFNQMAESIERSEKLRRDMTADIAHELRNPLAVMQARVEAILDGVYPPTPETLVPVLDQTRLLNRLVDDLRTLALADAGQLTLDLAESDLKSLIERVLEAHRAEAEAAGIALRLEASQASARVDPMRLEQVLGNLLSNALQHTPPGGEVTVRLSAEPSRKHVSLEVADTGEGIPDEELPYIFERFYRSDRPRAGGRDRTGLGLAITRQLVEAHGGSVRAANRPSGGAVFVVELPLR